MPGETAKNPVYTRILTDDLTLRKLLAVSLLTIIPVGVAILMQNSALRQKIALQLWHSGEVSATKISRSFEVTAKRCHDMYEIARLLCPIMA